MGPLSLYDDEDDSRHPSPQPNLTPHTDPDQEPSPMIVGIQQTSGAFEVEDAIISTKESTFVVHNSRILIEPIDSPGMLRAQRVADLICKFSVVCIALYLLVEVAIGFTSGAFARLVAR